MSTTLRLPKAVEDALRSVNPSTSRRSFLRSSGALVLSCSISAVPGGRVITIQVSSSR